MERDKEYNGWFNYETWNVALWMDNDSGSYEFWKERTIEAWENAKENRRYPTQTRLEAAACELADAIKQEHEENTPETTGVYADLLNAALSEVDWYEIAEHWIEAAEFETEQTA